MTRLNDDAIAAEDGPALPFPPRLLADWLALDETEKSADNIGGRIAGAVEWSALALAAGGDVQFSDYQAMARTLNGGRLTMAAWGKLALANPVVAAALDAAEREEAVGKVSGVFRCNACLDAGDLGARFEWGGALFIHLLTCQRFTAGVSL